MAAKQVLVRIHELTTRQLLQHVVIPTLNSLESKMSDLGSAVDDLKSAVDGVAQRLLPEIAALEEALAAAQLDDADAANAVANIRTEVDRLNALGTDPSTPVDTETPPEEPPEVEVPADPDAPHADNTLPGDLPSDAAPNQDLPGDQPAPNQDLPGA